MRIFTTSRSCVGIKGASICKAPNIMPTVLSYAQLQAAISFLLFQP